MIRALIPLLLLASAIVPMNAAQTSGPAHSDADLNDAAPVYLALGDSLAFGAGASDPNVSAYVPLVHDALKREAACPSETSSTCGDLQLLNLAENGATTVSLQETQVPAAVAILEERNGDSDPHNDVVVITVTIGGNDAFSALIQVCASSINIVCAERMQQTLGTIERNLTSTLRQLREAAGPDTRIAVMTYFNSLIACDFEAAAPNADLVLEGAPGLTRGLNGVIRLSAERANAEVAETFGILQAEDLVGGVDCLHANDAGYRKITEAFVSVLTSESTRDDSQ